MIIQLSDLGQVHLVCGKTDMRQGIDSLAYVVKTHFELDPFSFVVDVKTALKFFTGMVKDFGYYINALRTEN
ncbi:transposase%2C ISSmi4 [Streptococcus pneumoniae]|nr:transposase%2C ISSmi4 [Streptococcus pneumoniae]CVS33841.1 transposase%2C ISSmi4 [Streptococcus pneumoniae]CVT22740.1 transposase%2C ISSmi4 [Streptococcus pneumoniae]CVV22956.1 transposase%2C ISSmi4 [Streptococcus pneumoniae]CVZ49648.1 transposase%2C ISSmi4 [Streptococcus pneumoniae]